MTTSEPPLSAPSASSQALPADQDGPAFPTAAYRIYSAWVKAGYTSSKSVWDAIQAAYDAGEERGWHRGFDHARRYPAPTAAASSAPTGMPGRLATGDGE